MTDSPGGMSAAVPDQPLTPGPVVPASRPRRMRMIGGVVGALAVVAAATFAFTQLRSNAGDGGAASPEEVGQQLLRAIDNEDALGAIDLLLPGERETFRQPMIDLISELSRLGIAADKVDLNDVSGFDLEITDPAVSVKDTNVDDIANVTVRGQSHAVIDGKRVPLGDLLIKEAFGGTRPDMDSDRTSDFHATFASVKKSGRWYLSLMYSIAESARGERDIPRNGIVPIGASSPDGAVEQLLQSISDLRLEDAVANLNPDEAEAMQRYAPLFVDSAQRAIDDSELQWRISDTSYKVTGDGKSRQVAITALTFEASANGDSAELTFKDGCVDGTFGDSTFHSCVGDSSSGGVELSELVDSLGIDDGGSITKLVEDVQASLKDLSIGGLTVKQVRGSWYVSPIGSYFNVFLATLRSLSRTELETIIGDVRSVASSIEESIAGGFGPDDGSFDGGLADSDWTACLYSADDDPQGCIRLGIEEGRFDAGFIPAAYVYPQCGLFDYYFGSELYSDSGPDFHAKIVAAAPCITKAAKADGIDLSYTSAEFVHPECYENVNPYNYDSATEEDMMAANACAYG